MRAISSLKISISGVRGVIGDSHPLDKRDGVKVTLPGGWFLVRASNTEPIIRVVAEAESQTQASDIVSDVSAQVQACLALEPLSHSQERRF